MPVRSIRPIALALLAAALALPACTSRRTSDRDLVTIEVDDAPRAMSGSPGLFGLGATAGGVYVDARSANEYRLEHIPGAISLPFRDVDREEGALRRYDLLVVYGDDYDDAIAKAMAKKLLVTGHDDVRVLHGGLRAWKDAGLETDSGAPDDDE